ncbi:MAG: tRNA lysidine(34) synthetase TilS [Acidiferrobacteraceae bacterium]
MKRHEAFSPQLLERVLFGELNLPRNSHFAVAFSGGADSFALLHALTRIPGLGPGTVRAIHVHHGLHLSADDWVRHCAAACGRLGVACTSIRVTVSDLLGRGPEAAARMERYDRLREMLADKEVLLTAHHENDQAETVLLQLLRGAGIGGMSAIPRSVPFGRGQLVRPLLDVPGPEIRRYARGHGLVWVEDPSNKDCRYSRNFLRHRVMPLIMERWPAAPTVLARGAQHAASARSLLEEVADEDLARCAASDVVALRVEALQGLSGLRLANLLRRWLFRCGVECDTRQLRRLVLWMGKAPASASARISWPGADLRRYRGLLYHITSGRADDFTPLTWDLAAPLRVPALGLTLVPSLETGRGLACARAPSVEVRLRQGGEICRVPPGGHRRRLKKLLQDRGIPPWERDRLPLLFAGGDLAAVGDLWVCSPFAASNDERGTVIRIGPLI